MDVIYTWRTKKTNSGYISKVIKLTPRDTKNEQNLYCDSEMIHMSIHPTRAKAKCNAQRLVRQLKRG